MPRLEPVTMATLSRRIMGMLLGQRETVAARRSVARPRAPSGRARLPHPPSLRGTKSWWYTAGMHLRCAACLLSVAATLGCGTSGPTAPGPSGRPVRGSLDKKVIKDVIQEHHREVRACYEMELVKQPDLAGRV